MWVLEKEPALSGRADSALYHQVLSLAPFVLSSRLYNFWERSSFVRTLSVFLSGVYKLSETEIVVVFSPNHVFL